jgi:competence protein ComEC
LVGLVLMLPMLLRFAAARWLAWVIIAFVWTAASAHFALNDRWPAGAAQRDVAVSGWIDDFPLRASDRSVFSLRVTAAQASGIPGRLRLSWYDPPADLESGAYLEIVARLRSPRGLANPDGFDYEQWLFVEGYGATGYVRSGRVVADPPRALAQRWARLRADLAKRMDAAAGSVSGGALLVALTLGERYGFTEQQWTDLRRTGTSHLVAISGLHISMIAALAYWLLRSLFLRIYARRAAELAGFGSAVAAFAYTALAGFAVPAQRTLIMVLVALAVVSSRRVTGSFNGIAVALIIVLAAEPLATMTISFWLSFVAVALLLLLATRRAVAAPAMAPSRSKLEKVRAAVRLQWAITLGLTPFVAAFFGELAPYSPLVNLIAIPALASAWFRSVSWRYSRYGWTPQSSGSCTSRQSSPTRFGGCCTRSPRGRGRLSRFRRQAR